jgi:four helix bundle protein
MGPEDLKKRTKEFAVRIIILVKDLEKNGGMAGRIIANQLIRSGTSIAANYRAACRCKSPKDFISKIGTVVEEADETQLWLELLVEADIVKLKLIEDLLKESGEIVAIMTASKNTAVLKQAKH